MLTYPINLVGLAGRRCLVAGGGPIAHRKVEGLLAAGAQVRVVAPEVTGELTALARRGTIELDLRPYAPGDVYGAFVVIVATDDTELNREISAEAQARGALVNVVDDPEASNFIVPAVVRRGEMMVTVSTGGASPALARRMREWLDSQIDPAYDDLLQLMAELRPQILAQFGAGPPRLRAALRLVDDRELFELLRGGNVEGGRARGQRLLDEESARAEP